MVWDRAHASAETDVSGALRGGGDEHFRRSDDLVSAQVVLADPGLIESQTIQVLDQLEVALQALPSIRGC
jgi:hypothetical protein